MLDLKFSAGAIATSLAFITVACGQNIVVNPGFETTESLGTGLPTSYGDWNGNRCSIVGAQSGVSPRTGSQMLRFDGTSTVGDGAGGGIGGNVYQLLDISPWADRISSGRVVVTATAYFNRVAGDSQTDTQFTIEVFAYAGAPSDFPSQALSAFLVRQTNCLLSDANAATWQALSTQVLIPPDADYIAVAVSAIENVFNDFGPPEFDGHFADDVLVEVDAPCVGDTNFDGAVDVDDLIAVILNWGRCVP